MRLSEFELEVMNLIWVAEEITCPEIHQAIIASRDVTYSTVKTIIDRLENKGAAVRSGQVGRTIFYRANVTRESIRGPLIDEFVRRVFGGDKRPLFNHLLSGEELSEAEAAYLESLLKQHRTDRDDG